jgi:hypothetical protein
MLETKFNRWLKINSKGTLTKEAWKTFMKLSKRRALLLAFCIAVLCSLLVLVPLLMHPEPDLETAITKAIDFLEDEHEPYALLWLDAIYRRFGIEEFADSLQRYDQVLTEHPEGASLLRVFRRIADYDNELLQEEDFKAVSLQSDLIIVHALYCDRLELPVDYPKMLDREAREGGYHLTHVLLAWIWVQENGCELALPDGFIDELYSANAAIINNDPTTVDDLKLEAAAFLYLAGQGGLVDDSFVERAIVSQNGDGSWGQSSDNQDESYWHSTILGLLLLLHVESPADSYPPMLDSASK